MDDLSVISCIEKKYFIKESNGCKQHLIPLIVQQKMVELLQYTIDKMVYYLSINNIPQNEKKTQLITFNELEYKKDNVDNNNQIDIRIISR